MQLGFETVGLSIDDTEFRVPADGAYNDEKAVQETSALTDNALRFSENIAARTGLSVSGLQEFILSALPVPGSSPESAAVFERLKADAARKFDLSSRPSLDAAVEFAAVEVTPERWYDPSAPVWTSYSYTAEDRTDASPPASPPHRWTWGVMQPSAVVALAQPPRVAAAMLAPGTVAAAASGSPFALEVARTRHEAEGVRFRTLGRRLGTGRAGTADATAGRTLNRRRRIGRARALGRDESRRVEGVGAGSRSAGMVRGALVSKFVRDSGLLVSTNPTPEPVAASKVTVTFKYVMVTIARPWWVSNLLQLPNWYIPGLQAGWFSNGRLDDNDGKAPMLPVAFIAVRELAIVGQWSASDQAVMDRSLRLGPFALAGRTIERSSSSTTLSVPFTQVIAWVGQPLPACPPADDPAAVQP